MNDNECKFDLQPLYCDYCGAYIGVLGTCEDYALCDTCQSRDLKHWDEGARRGYDLVYSPREEKGKAPVHTGKVNLYSK